jgi:hypothetical protein
MTMASADRRRQIRYASVRRNDITLCRTNGCTTRMLPTGDGRLRCPICLLTISLARPQQRANT